MTDLGTADPPFELVQCSWPRPVVQDHGRWISEPEWDAPVMPALPQPRWRSMDGMPCWSIDWCRTFAGGLWRWGSRVPGEMCGFHVVFHLRVTSSGTLLFWDDDGSIIRRNGEVIHCDRSIHPLTCSSIEVRAGDRLEVAQWQAHGEWAWGACIRRDDRPGCAAVDVLLPYLEAVERHLLHPNGPALKLFTQGTHPVRAVLAIYSMVLNGYPPSDVLIFGEHQWAEESRRMFSTLLPFAQIVCTEDVMRTAAGLGQPGLAAMALQHWNVMKTCVGVLFPPHEYCMMDDDVVILDHLDDALLAFQRADLVFAPDADCGIEYQATWGRVYDEPKDLPTARINTGLYWLRNTRERRQLAAAMLQVPPHREPVWQWDQGFIATQFAGVGAIALPSQRYFYPYFDGLPGGINGYDYRRNPCGFGSLHFGGLSSKPSDDTMCRLAADVLSRHTS